MRGIAKKAGLFTAAKKDSQGICFLGDVDMREFLLHYIQEKKGNVVNEEGEVIGEHDGVWFYTLGERHGFVITKKTPNDKPHYVVGKHIARNELVVSTKPQGKAIAENIQTVVLRDANWQSAAQEGKTYSAQFRYHGERMLATITKEGIVLQTNAALPLGQSLVVYENDVLLGGGIIDKVK